jgi:peptidoglycan/xylan/chitin deacetylase (PgdA/CDA1 family)
MPGMGRIRSTARRMINRFVPRAVILLYHRVAELPSDPQLLSVSPQHFAEHLEILRKQYSPVPLHQADPPSKASVIITFDDGYSDNLRNAKPLLERYDVPATVFVTTGYVGRDQEFWWDELERLLLDGGTLPQTLCLNIQGASRRWELGSGDSYQHNPLWNVLEKDDPSPRHSAYRSLHRLVRPMAEVERQIVLDQLRQFAFATSKVRPSYRALSSDEVIELAEGGLVEIGGHTVTHPVLSTLAESAQFTEIQQSKSHLEDVLGHPVTSFAYPYGSVADYTEATVAAVRQTGYLRACSNFFGTVGPNCDRFQLPRFLVRDWDGDTFSRQVRAWFDA